MLWVRKGRTTVRRVTRDMIRIHRLPLVLAAFAAVASSQALIHNYDGTGSATAVGGVFSTTSTGPRGADQFNFVRSETTASLTQVKLFDATGNNGLTLVYANPTIVTYPDGSGSLFQAVATATGFGTLTGYAGTNIGITRNLRTAYEINIQGVANPVPEPASIAALGLGAVALIRRRRKA